jgi:hypothetical protein
VQYPLIANADPESVKVRDCIRLINNPSSRRCCPGTLCVNPTAKITDGSWVMKQWRLCFGSNRNGETALLTINSFDGVGMNTNLSFEDCS